MKRVSKVGRTSLIESLERRALFSVGALDPTFGNGGVADLSAYTGGGASAVESSGKVVETTDQGIVQLNTDGSIDTSFGGAGLAGTTFVPVAVRVAADGKIVAAGTVLNRFAVERFNADGTPDSTFGTAGYATARDRIHRPLVAGDVVVQSNGQVIVGGSELNPYTTASVNPSSDISKAIFIRFTTTGTLDTTYGTAGVLDVGDGFSNPVHMGLLSDGSVISTIQFVNMGQKPFSQIIEVDTTGQAVSQLVSDYDGVFKSIAVGALDRIAVVAVPQTGSTVLQVYSAGDLDTTFNGSGTLNLTKGDRVTLEPNGTFLVVNDGSALNLQPLAIHRVLANGTVDATFANGGVLAPAFGNQAFEVTGPAVPLANGDLIIPGSDDASNDGSVFVAKVQIATPSTVTNPTVGGVTFAANVGSRYGYATITFSDTAADVDPASVDTTISVVATTGVSGANTTRTITANLSETGGGNGDPLTATYAFRINRSGIGRADSGLYQFVVPGSLAFDTNGRGSVGGIAGTYTLYIPRGRKPTSVIASAATPLATI